ncbi:MAG: GAF domain-containing protein [Desulfuromonadaceae bacterium]|nr:GAF domain-containing protein [Desulfuromonadaceae bacterium]MDD2847375.1 GAF domain-containing protein [Desulfuromonadaceae bacterium]MDD4131512.1 GAF domain-containing protein [Desulfuromonadaceae bacterium]
MTIKAKLITNGLVTAGIIVFISLSCFSSMRFIQDKLLYLAEKSAPFQIRTVEFQSGLQSSITSLIKVNAARNMAEYAASRAEAETSLQSIRDAQAALEKLSGGSSPLTVSEELNPIANELFAAAEARISSDISARDVNARISQQVKESTVRLKELETLIHNLQVTHSVAFAKTLADTTRFSERLRDLEELRNLVKDLLTISETAFNARNNTTFLIAKGKATAILGRITRNKQSKNIPFVFKLLSTDTHEFLQFQAATLTQKDEESKKWAQESFTELAEKINRLHLTLNQEIELAASHLETETKRQADIFREESSANATLLANSELVALGLLVTGEINQMFNLESVAELEKLGAEIDRLFKKISEQVHAVEINLSGLNAREELKILRATASSLAAIRTELYSTNGIITTLKTKLDSIQQANNSADKLHALVFKQSAKGNETVTAARSEQEESIVAVNGMTNRSLSRISTIGSIAIAIGILLSFWIYRSVMQPLGVILNAVRTQQTLGKEKASLAEAVAAGDLGREVSISEAMVIDPARVKSDEMGMVLNAVAGMSVAQSALDRAFAGMTASLRHSRDEDARRDHLKSGLHELNKILRDEHKTAELADEALAFMADFLGAGVGIMYLYDVEGELLQTLSTYAISREGRLNWGFRLGEGLPGQVALERKTICLNAVPDDYLPITSALGTAKPLNVVIMPILHHETLVGVLELGSFTCFGDDDFEFLKQALEGIAIAIEVNSSRQRMSELLEKTQAQSEELLVQQEELQQTNDELAERASMLAELT